MLNNPNLKGRVLRVPTGIAAQLVNQQGGAVGALMAGLEVTPSKIFNPYGFVAESNIGQPIPVAAPTVLQYPTTILPDGGWNSLDTYTIPIPGRWGIAARNTLVIGAAGGVITFYIYITLNGNQWRSGNGQLYTQPAGGLAVTMSSQIDIYDRFKQGDKIQVVGWHNYAVPQNTSGVGFNDWFMAHLISSE